MLTILRNRFFKDIRRPRPLPATTVGLEFDALPREAVENDEVDRDRLQEALAAIPPDFRIVLLMFYFEDCSYREIARQLELPMGTVMSRLARAKGYLRARLFSPWTARRREAAATPSVARRGRRRGLGSGARRVTARFLAARWVTARWVTGESRGARAL